jgi:hypothetical protein
MFLPFPMKSKKSRIPRPLSGAYATVCRILDGVEVIELTYQKILTGTVVRVSVSVPEPDGSHLIRLERWLRDQWTPLGVIRDCDILPLINLLAKAYEWMHPTTISGLIED